MAALNPDKVQLGLTNRLVPFDSVLTTNELDLKGTISRNEYLLVQKVNGEQ
jgi:hypothetical protein